MKVIASAAVFAVLTASHGTAFAQTTGSAPLAIPEIVTRCLLREHDSGGALANCTEAIATPGLPPTLQALVYNARGEAHCESGDYDLALADQDAAVRLVPNFPEAWSDRASCLIGKHDLPGAIASYDEAIRLAPVPGYYAYRAELLNWMGLHDRALADYEAAIKIAPRSNTTVDEYAKTLFDLGRYDEAATQFLKDIRMTPGDPYPVLWLHLSRLRAHRADAEEFQAGIDTLDLTGWPGPIFDLFRGRGSVDAMKRAAMLSPDDAAEKFCQANVYEGEYDLARGDVASALAPLDSATLACNSRENQFLTVWAELKRYAPATHPNGPW